MKKMLKNLGVKFFVKEPHAYQFESMDGIDMSDYDYFFEVRDMENWNGNGYKEIDIYTDGEIKVIEVGNWKVVPIVRMPFNWTGYSLVLKVFDKDENMHTFKVTADKTSQPSKTDFLIEAKWLAKRISTLHEIESVAHANLLEVLESAKRHVSYKNDFITIRTINGAYEKLEPIIKAIKGDELNENSKAELIEGVKYVEDKINEQRLRLI